MHHEEKQAGTMTIDEIKAAAASVAEQMKAVPTASETPASSGGGSLHRGLPADVRERFIAVRGALYARGVYDPVLVRFDTASVPQAATAEVADRLAEVASSL
jgi:hypothetical protein